jgi:hypothetical protein
VALVSVGCVYKAFIEGAVAFIDKGSLFIGGLSKAAKAGVADDIKGINGRDLRQYITDLEILVVLVTRLLRQDLDRLVNGMEPVEPWDER